MPAASISFEALDTLRRRLVDAEREVSQLRKANAKLRAAADAYQRRAEMAEACAKRIFQLAAR